MVIILFKELYYWNYNINLLIKLSTFNDEFYINILSLIEYYILIYHQSLINYILLYYIYIIVTIFSTTK
jgi:hypothetical protein